MRWVLHTISALMVAVGLIGCVSIAYAIVGAYMVIAGYVEPGQPVYVDELAPTYLQSLSQFLVGAGLVTLALVSRAVVRRRLSASAA